MLSTRLLCRRKSSLPSNRPSFSFHFRNCRASMKLFDAFLTIAMLALSTTTTAFALDDNSTSQATSTITCANVRCQSGTQCVLKQVQCVRAPCPPVPTCEATTQPPVTQSSDVCTPGFCPDSQTCELKQVQCIRAPCAPVPTCVPSKPSPGCTKKCGRFQRCYLYNQKPYCADVCSPSRCKKGEVCELQTVQCLVAPCPPVATCKQA